MDKTIFKKTGEELQEFLKFRKRGSKVKAKKGKGSFSRKQKHKNKDMCVQLNGRVPDFHSGCCELKPRHALHKFKRKELFI